MLRDDGIILDIFITILGTGYRVQGTGIYEPEIAGPEQQVQYCRMYITTLLLKAEKEIAEIKYLAI